MGLTRTSHGSKHSPARGARLGHQPRATAFAVIFVAAIAAATVVLGYVTLFSRFGTYDDAGYFLISIKSYQDGATLYNDIFAEYGPFFFEFMAGAFKVLGFHVTNDGGLAITLGLWLAAALLLGAAAYRLSRLLVVGVVVDLLAFRIASSVPDEPTSPGHLLIFVLSATVAVAVFLVPRRPRLALALIGALGAMALLSKANIGVLALAATAFACVLASPRLLRVRPLVYAITAAFVLTPIILMSRSLLDAGWARYGVHVTLCALAIALVACSSSRAEGDDNGAAWWPAWAAAGALLLTTAVVGVVLAQGTTISALLDSTVVLALNQVNAFSLAVQLPTNVLVWDAVSVAAAVSVAKSGIPRAGRWRVGAGLIRVIAGVWIWVGVIGASPLAIPASLAWIAAVPVHRDGVTPAARFVRTFLPALAVLQMLHAYPVAGSQRAWSAILLVMVGAVCVADGLAELDLVVASRGRLSRVAASAGIGLVTWTIFTALVFPFLDALNAYRAGVSLGVPGAGRIRVSSETAATYQGLVAALKSHCSTFISSPGLGSLYIMSGDKPPTFIDASAWMFSVDERTQARAVRQVQNVPRLCAVRSANLEAFWAQGRPIPQRPLYQFILQDFHTVESPGGYDVMVRNAK